MIDLVFVINFKIRTSCVLYLRLLTVSNNIGQVDFTHKLSLTVVCNTVILNFNGSVSWGSQVWNAHDFFKFGFRWFGNFLVMWLLRTNSNRTFSVSWMGRQRKSPCCWPWLPPFSWFWLGSFLILTFIHGVLAFNKSQFFTFTSLSGSIWRNVSTFYMDDVTTLRNPLWLFLLERYNLWRTDFLGYFSAGLVLKWRSHFLKFLDAWLLNFRLRLLGSRDDIVSRFRAVVCVQASDFLFWRDGTTCFFPSKTRVKAGNWASNIPWKIYDRSTHLSLRQWYLFNIRFQIAVIKLFLKLPVSLHFLNSLNQILTHNMH